MAKTVTCCPARRVLLEEWPTGGSTRCFEELRCVRTFRCHESKGNDGGSVAGTTLQALSTL